MSPTNLNSSRRFKRRHAAAVAALSFTLAAAGGVAVLQSTNASAVAQEYSWGEGKYANLIQWINWGAGKNFATAADLPEGVKLEQDRTFKVGTYVEMELAPDYIVRAEVTSIGGVTTPNSVGTIEAGGTNNMPMWARNQDGRYSEMRKTGYGTNGQTVISPYADGGKVEMTVALTAMHDGQPVPVDAIFTDGESANHSDTKTERIYAVTDGDPWLPLFNTNNAEANLPMWVDQLDTPANAGFFTKTFGGFSTAGRRVPVGISRNAKNVNIKIDSPGMQNAMFGFFFEADSGDAPASYGKAIAQLKYTANAELTTVDPKQADDNAPNAPRIVDERTIFLGSTKPDPNMVYTGDWATDNVVSGAAVNDENVADTIVGGAFPALSRCTSRFTFEVNASAPDGTPVAGWIDFNNNGTFDAAERAEGTVKAGKAALTFAGGVVPAEAKAVGSRLWIASDARFLQNATGASPDGEVQDELVPLTAACVPTTSTSKQGATQTADAKAMFPDTNLTGATFSFGVAADGKPVLTQPAKDASGATVGTYTIDPATGAITFKPLNTFVGTPSPATVSVNLANGNIFNATHTPTVTPITPAPKADTQSTPQGSAVTLNPLTNDVAGDPAVPLKPDTVQLTSTGLPAGSTVAPDGKSATVPGEGTYKVAPDGSITFTPEPTFIGSATPITYSVKDAFGTATTSTVTIDVYGVKPATKSGTQGQPVAVPPVTHSIDPTTLKFLPEGLPAGSTVTPDGKSATVPGEGTWTIDPKTEVMTFTPAANFTGDPTPISYTGANKPGGAFAPSATVTVVYPDVDDASGSGNQGTPVTLKPDLGSNAVPSSVKIVPEGLPEGSTFSPDGKTVTVPGEGTWVISPEGALTFTPADGFQDDPTPVRFTAADKDGNTSSPATATIVYPDVTDVTGGGNQGSNVTVKPILDAQGVPDSVRLLPEGLPEGSTVSEDGKTATVPGQGTWTVDPKTGAISFTPEKDFTGNPTPIKYTASDKDGNTATPATVTITYPDVEDTPISGTGNQGTPVTVVPKIGPGADPGTIRILPDGLPDGSTVNDGGKKVTVPGEGTWTVNPDGSITFTPEEGFQGDPTPIKFTAEDKDGHTATPGIISVKYPDVTDTTGGGNQGTPVTVVPTLDEDAIPGTIKFVPDGLPEGSTVGEDGKSAKVPGEGTWVINPDGSITFTPEDGFQGDPTPIQFTAADKDGNTSTPGKIIVKYPDVDESTGSGTQGKPVTVQPTLDEDAVPGTVKLIPGGLPEGSTVSDDGKSATVPGEGTWTVNPNGSITFTPEDGFQGDPTPIQFTATDKDGNTAIHNKVVVKYPDVSDSSGHGDQGTPVTVTPVLDEQAIPGTVKLLPNGLPKGSTVSEDGKSATVPGEGSWTVNPEGQITFTPEGDFQGDPTPIQFTAADKDGNTANPAAVLVSFPDAKDLTGSGDEGTAVKVPTGGQGLVPNTITFPKEGQPKGSIVSEDGKSVLVPNQGTWTIDPNTGDIVFTPVADFEGNPTPVFYEGSDEKGNQTKPATITVTYPPAEGTSGGTLSPGSSGVTSGPDAQGNAGNGSGNGSGVGNGSNFGNGSNLGNGSGTSAPYAGVSAPTWSNLARTGVNGLLAGAVTAALVAAGVVLTVVGRRRRQK